MHCATRAFLNVGLARSHDGPTVVVTDHAPQSDGLPDRHAHLAWYDASDLTELVDERGPDPWARRYACAYCMTNRQIRKPSAQVYRTVSLFSKCKREHLHRLDFSCLTLRPPPLKGCLRRTDTQEVGSVKKLTSWYSVIFRKRSSC